MIRKPYPTISVIIPAKPDGQISAALEALKKVNYPQKSVEILIARGFVPSRQRNEAAKRAKGKILYFLDNDSQIHQEAFKRMVAAFDGRILGRLLPVRGFSLLPASASRLIEKSFFPASKATSEIAAVGGPNIWDGKESFWSSIGGIILESFFAHWKMAARYRPIGKFRVADEKELILCNLAIKKRVFSKLGGFCEELYPNEENEFLNRFAQKNYDAVYHPGIFVFKPRRESFYQIIRTFFTYGRGRMEQVRIEGVVASLPFFSPLVLFFYLLSLFFYCLATSFAYRPGWLFLPLVLYLFLGFGSAVGFAVRRKKIYLALLLPLFFLIAHLTYALGLLWGLGTDLEKKKRKSGRKIEVIKMKSLKGLGEA